MMPLSLVDPEPPRRNEKSEKERKKRKNRHSISEDMCTPIVHRSSPLGMYTYDAHRKNKNENKKDNENEKKKVRMQERITKPK